MKLPKKRNLSECNKWRGITRCYRNTSDNKTLGTNIGIRQTARRSVPWRSVPNSTSRPFPLGSERRNVSGSCNIGSCMPSGGDTKTNVRARIGKAASIFQRLRSEKEHCRQAGHIPRLNKIRHTVICRHTG